MEVAVAEPAAADVVLNVRLFIEAVGSKFVPATLTAVPAEPIVGEKLLIVGAALAPEVTTKFVVLFAVAAATVTEIGPVVAPAGTVVVSLLAVAAVTLATTPLNVTAFDEGVVLKPVP